jgi:hypothetical protein
MHINEIIQTWKNPERADKSAVGTINRPLQVAGVVCSMAQSAPMVVRFILFICIIVPSADYTDEQNNPGIRRGKSTVMLSTCAALSVNSAKHLSARRDRPFAALRVTV